MNAETIPDPSAQSAAPPLPFATVSPVADWHLLFADDFPQAWSQLIALLEDPERLADWIQVLREVQSRRETSNRVFGDHLLADFRRELSWIIDNRDPLQCVTAPNAAESMARLCLHPEALRKASAIRLGDPYAVEEVRRLIAAETELVGSWLQAHVASGAVENWLGRRLDGLWVAGWRAFPDETGAERAPTELSVHLDPNEAMAKLADFWLLNARQIAAVLVD